jgi:hypothetical protein
MQSILGDHRYGRRDVRNLVPQRPGVLAPQLPSAAPAAIGPDLLDVVDLVERKQPALVLLVPRLSAPPSPRGFPLHRSECSRRIRRWRPRRVLGVLVEPCSKLGVLRPQRRQLPPQLGDDRFELLNLFVARVTLRHSSDLHSDLTSLAVNGYRG